LKTAYLEDNIVDHGDVYLGVSEFSWRRKNRSIRTFSG